jgi:glycosidase
LPGIPLLYNGEEVGNSKRLDLFEAVPIDWSKGQDFRSFYRLLGLLRKEFPWLSDGPINELRHTGGQGVLAYERRSDDGSAAVIVVLNFASEDAVVTVDLPEDLRKKSLHDLLGGANLPPGEQLSINLSPRGFAVYTRKK